MLHNPDLAATLRRISEEGSAGFYQGTTADLLVAEMRRGGGITLGILANMMEGYDLRDLG